MTTCLSKKGPQITKLEALHRSRLAGSLSDSRQARKGPEPISAYSKLGTNGGYCAENRDSQNRDFDKILVNFP
jgi:hypothetical protein